MKTSRTIIRSLLVLTLLCLPVLAQQPSPEVTRFSKNGLAFDYPTSMQMTDASTENGQHLILLHGEKGAQIMVISRYTQITSAEQLATAQREVFGSFAETMWKELQKLDPKVSRTPVQIAIGGAQATGLRLRAVLNNEPGSAELYSLLLGRRLVVVSLIGSDKEIAAIANAWSTIRSSLKSEESAPAAAPKQLHHPAANGRRILAQQ